MRALTVPWRPWWGECKVRVSRSWFGVLGFSLGGWAIGFGFDVAPTNFGIVLGPLSAGIERDEPPPESYDDLPDWSRTLRRIVIKRWKLELRLEFDLNLWLFGYMMANAHDHGVYLGPFNLQIEYDICWDAPNSLFYDHPRVHRAFVAWLNWAWLRMEISVKVDARTRQHIHLSFIGINPAIRASLTDRQLTVFVEWEVYAAVE